MIFTVVEGAPPDVWVDLAFLKVKASERVQLLGFYKTSVEPVKVEWTSSQEQGEFIAFLSSKLQDVCRTTFFARRLLDGLQKVRTDVASRHLKYSL